MKANELRIGNWALGYDGEEFQWDLEHFGLMATKRLDADEIGRPIPLTEEWLLKFGFEWKGADHYENGDYWLEDYKGGFRFCRPHFCHVVCKQVHQLQNLYQCLTGEELTIKEPA